MGTTLTYIAGSERPTARLWLLDDDGSLIDFSSGYTFEFRIGTLGSAADVSKTMGITGAAGSGVEPTGVPNIVVSWESGELDEAGLRWWQFIATDGGGHPRKFQGDFEITYEISESS